MKPPSVTSGGDKPPLRNKNGTFSETEIAAIIAGACDFVASFRGDHWHRTPKQCEPLARPLSEALTKMSPAMARKVAEMSLPVSIVMGAVTVFGPAVMTEVDNAKLIAADRAEKADAGRTGVGNFGTNQAEPLYSEAGFSGNGVGGWEGNPAGAYGVPPFAL